MVPGFGSNTTSTFTRCVQMEPGFFKSGNGDGRVGAMNVHLYR